MCPCLIPLCLFCCAINCQLAFTIFFLFCDLLILWFQLILKGTHDSHGHDELIFVCAQHSRRLRLKGNLATSASATMVSTGWPPHGKVVIGPSVAEWFPHRSVTERFDGQLFLLRSSRCFICNCMWLCPTFQLQLVPWFGHPMVLYHCALPVSRRTALSQSGPAGMLFFVWAVADRSV